MTPIIQEHQVRDRLSQKGFSLIEVILSVALISLISTGFIAALIFGQESTAFSGRRIEAIALAEEGIEAVRSIRDNDFSQLSAGTYGIDNSASQWELTGTPNSIGDFNRSLVISTIDANRVDVESRISWQQNPQRSGLISLMTRLTNWQAAASGLGNWSLPAQAAILDVGGNNNGWKVQIQGDYAYAVRSSGSPSFIVVDLSTPSSPTIVGTLSPDGNPRNIAVSGNYAYVASTSNNEEIQIINISNPTSPSIAASYNAPSRVDMFGVYVYGNTLYASRDSSAQDELYIIDITTPTSPSLLGSLDLGWDANEVFSDGSYAYIVSDDNNQELQIVDVTTPSSPVLAGVLDLPGAQDGATITGFTNTIIVGRNGGETHTVDVTTPSSPALLGTYNAGSNVRDIALGASNAYAFLATTSNASEFQIIDISTPAIPVVVGSFDAPSNLNGIAYHTTGDYVVAVGDDNNEEITIYVPQ